MKVYYDKDADLSLIKGKQVAIVGYGSQGHAHAQNLNDSGVKVTVALRRAGASWTKAEKAGLKVAEIAAAVKAADVVMILLPDEQIAGVYAADVGPNLKPGASLAFAHCFNIHYGQVIPRADIDVWMVAPKAPGHTVRDTYTRGGGVPQLIAVHQDQSGKARDLALSYAAANGGGKAGIIETRRGRVRRPGRVRDIRKPRRCRSLPRHSPHRPRETERRPRPVSDSDMNIGLKGL